MFEGRCPKCKAHYVGWALSNPKNRMCDRCGAELEIVEHCETPGRKDITRGIEGKCPRCGAQYMGRALRDPKYRTCDECGSEIEIVA